MKAGYANSSNNCFFCSRHMLNHQSLRVSPPAPALDTAPLAPTQILVKKTESGEVALNHQSLNTTVILTHTNSILTVTNNFRHANIFQENTK